MSAVVIKEVWDELKRHINVVDREEAAETLVSVLVDNDVDVDEIRSAFKSDPAVKAALQSYIKDHEQDDEPEEDEEDFEYDQDDEDDDY